MKARVINPTEENVEPTLTDDQILGAVNHPWISEMNPRLVQLGRELLGEVKEQLVIAGLARKIFASRIVKAGEVIRYDKDEDQVAYMINEKGDVVKVIPNVTVASKVTKRTPKEAKFNPHYVYPDEHEVVVYPSMPKGMFRDADLAKEEVKKIQEKAFQALMYQEDAAALALLLEAGKENQKIKANPYDILDSLTTEFNQKRLICDKILMNRKDVNFFVKEFVNNPGKFKHKVDLVEIKELVMVGYVGTYNSAMIITTPEGAKEDIIPEGNPIAIASPEYLGGMPIRVELFSEGC